jgi:outer membrane protein assembly factor BamC
MAATTAARALFTLGLLSLFALLTTLSACGVFGEGGYIRDRQDDYLKAETLAPLKIPAGLDHEAIEDLYYVPPIDRYAQRPDDKETPRPQALVAGEFENMVKIQTLGRRQWILVRLLPGQVWPRLKDFLLAKGIGVEADDGATGTMQTPWVQDPPTVLQERYRLQLTQGVQRSTSEVHLLQMQRSATPSTTQSARTDTSSQWPPQSDDAQRARLMLQQIAKYLAETADVSAAVSLVAQGISTSRRLYLVTGDDPAIRVKLDRDRGWASLGYALDKSGFLVDSENSDTGIYMVRLNPEMQEQKKGMWKRFFARFKPGAKEAEIEAARLRVTLGPADDPDWMEIRIVSPAAEASGETNPEAQEQVLTLIKGYLT